MSLKHEYATLNLSVSRTLSQPIYLQLTQQIKQLIHEQRLQAPEKLPSTRKLAIALKVSRSAVVNAYEQLCSEGYLLAKANSGFEVRELLMPASNTNNAVKPQTPLFEKSKQVPQNEKNALEPITDKTPAQAFDSGPDVRLFPFKEWARSSGRVWRNLNPTLLQSFPTGGYAPLQKAIAHYLKVMRGLDCLPEQIMVTAGSRDALSLISHALVEDQNMVALENPCYQPLRAHFLRKNNSVLPCAIDSFGAQVPNTQCTLAWLTPSNQYPLGGALHINRALQWLEYSQKQSCWLVEDDFDHEFHYDSKSPEPLFNIAVERYTDSHNLVLHTGSFSKSLFTTLRVGYIVVPTRLIPVFHKAQSELGNVVSLPIQPVLADFLQQRAFYIRLRQMKGLYQVRRDELFELLDNSPDSGLIIQRPSAGTHLTAYLDASNKTDDCRISQKLAAIGVHANALSAHYTEQQKQGFLLGYSGCTAPQARWASKHLLEAIQSSY